MSPRLSFALTAAGVLLAGIPLLSLTGRVGVRPATIDGGKAELAENTPAADVPLVLTARWSGKLRSLVLRYNGQEWAVTDVSAGEWEQECRLPHTPYWEVEAEAEWQETDQESAQAVTLYFVPATLPERSVTHWTYPGDARLHSIFSVKGVEK